MSRREYFYNRFRRGMARLDRAAIGVAAHEPQPVTVTLPPRPGSKAATYTLDGYFDENPAVQTIATTGITNSLNGILYVRRNQMPIEFRRSADDESIAVGFRFNVRGREYRCTKASYARGEYAFQLSDLMESRYA